MVAKPDTRYGGKPLYPKLCGFSFDGQPCADGEYYLVGENLAKVQSDIDSLNTIVNETIGNTPLVSEDVIIPQFDDTIHRLRFDKDLTKEKLPRYPVVVRGLVRGHAMEMNLEDWIDEYTKSGEMHRGTMNGNLYVEEPVGWCVKTELSYLENGNLGYAIAHMWKRPAEGYERFDFRFRTIDNKLVLSKAWYSNDPKSETNEVYSFDGKEEIKSDRLNEPRYKETKKQGFLSRLFGRK